VRKITNQNYQTVEEINSANWERKVLGSKEPVFVDFWAPWCGPCRITAPVVENLAKEYSSKIKFVKVNVDDNSDLASRYNVFSIPTLALFNKGQVVAQQVGAGSKSSYQNMISRGLANSPS
jgi:thioredoxin 1